MTRIPLWGSLISVLLLTLAGGALADQRFFVWTYESKTVSPGEAEVETYFTLATPDRGSFEGQTSTQHQVELEVGMTKRFDFGIYQVFSQAPGGTLGYDGFKLRARYRMGGAGQPRLDPVAYLEYKGKPDLSEHGIEAKIILTHTFGRYCLALNPIAELDVEDGGWELEPEYAVGLSYGVGRLLRVGVEVKGSGSGHYLGPVIFHGTDRLWMTLGSAVGIAGVHAGSPQLQLRALLGVNLVAPPSAGVRTPPPDA